MYNMLKRETRTNEHKRGSEHLSLEDSIRNCREYNEGIFHIQEQIMHDLKQFQRTQRTTPRNNQDAKRHVPRRDYERSKSFSRRTHHMPSVVKKKRYSSSTSESNPERSPVRYKKRIFTHNELVGELKNQTPNL